jgi:GDP-L-fucose synthase
MFWKDKKILVSGGNGFIGKFIIKNLCEKRGIYKKNIFIPDIPEYDLRDFNTCLKVTEGIDIVIHLAAVVGGIEYNRLHSGSIFFDNFAMNTNMLEASRKNGVKRFLNVSSACAYPKLAPIPLKEDSLFAGPPEETNGTYGYAKRMMIVHSIAYRQQYGFDSINVIPFNAYGPGDKFDPKTSHVIPALIVKCFRDKELVVWGDGSPTRSFLYVDDFAEGVLLGAEKLKDSEPVNIGTDEETSIKQIVELIVKHTGFKGKVKWDTSKPNGQPRRCADITRAQELLGYKAKVSIDEGIRKTVEWYKMNVLSKT